MTAIAMRGLTLLVLIVGSLASEPKKIGDAKIGRWRFDVAGMDPAVKPGDDFFRYSNGTWLREATIPQDRSSWGPFFELRADSEKDVKAIVDEVTRRSNAHGTVEQSVEQKVADFYTSYLNTEVIESAGLEPVRADLEAIVRAKSYEDVARLMARPDIAVGGPFSMTPWPDPKNPNRYALNIVQSGLSLPDREYYLNSDVKSLEIRRKYRIYIERMLALGQYPDAARSSGSVLALETEMAKLQWSDEMRGNRDLTYHPKSRAGLKAVAPEYPWDTALSAAVIPQQDFFNVKELEPIRALIHLFRATPVETWRAYMTFHYLNGMADVLPVAFDDLSFDFNRKTLSGQPHKSERWRRAISALNNAMGEAVGKLYVERHFSAQAKTQVAALVENLRLAFQERIMAATWMSDDTKRAALRKLETFRVKIGYPDRWRDYTMLEVRSNDAVGNRKRAKVWEWRRVTGRLSLPTDREEWGMTPQTVNAYYNSYFNEIVFPAAILQPPYFDPNSDMAVNYGGIGGVIGHEMVHGFDDQGSKSDENGVMRTWWKAEDVANFQRLTGRLAAQYSAYEPIAGTHLNGELTLGENIGDNGGLSVALEAYRISLHGKLAPVLDGLTGEQRLFLSWAQSYREVVREPQLREDLVSDPHSPAEFRVNGVVRNMDAWYAAFGVKSGDKLYLAPAERVHLW